MLEIYLETKPDIGHSQIRTMGASQGSHNGHHLYLLDRINTENQLNIHSQSNGMFGHFIISQFYDIVPGNSKNSTGIIILSDGCQTHSGSNLLLALVNMVLDGPSITDHSEYSATSAALTIALLQKVKQRRREGPTTSDNVIYCSGKTYTDVCRPDRLSHVGVSMTWP